jgi:hypothetical protein
VLTRFWRDAGATRRDGSWAARCPVMSLDQPLFVFANVLYALPEPYATAEKQDAFGISSPMLSYRPDQLRAARVVATDRPSPLIDDGARGWHDWYKLNWGHPPLWVALTRKLKDPKWQGPDGARLAVDVKCASDNFLVFTVQCNDWGVYPGQPGGTYTVEKPLHGSPDWQTVTIGLDELVPGSLQNKPTERRLTDWRHVTELGLGASGTAIKDGKPIPLGGKPWPEPREFRNLRWVAK